MLIHGDNNEKVEHNGEEMLHHEQKSDIFRNKEQVNDKKIRIMLSTCSLTVGVDFNKDKFGQFTKTINLWAGYPYSSAH